MKQVDFSNPSLPSPWKGEEGIVRRNDPDEILQKFHGVNRSCKNGFSINEVMISMFVLSVGIVTVIELFFTGFINSALDRDRIVAAGLAQEGVELVKNIRDNNLAIGGNGFAPFNVLAGGRDVCGLDYTDTLFITSGGGRNCFGNGSNPTGRKFSLVWSGGYFTSPISDSGTNEKFGRMTYIDYDQTIPAAPFVDVISVVWWGGSNTAPAGVLDVSNNPTVLSNCVASNKCVYSQMRLEAWKP